MRRALRVLALFASASAALAQPANYVSLQIGTATVWLGMDRVSAKQKLESSGIYFPEKSSSDGLVIAADLRAKRLYTMKFENNKLVYADRNWLQDSDGLPSVMNALTSLVNQGATKCTIEHAPMSSPDTSLDRVFIDCGKRGILLTHGSTTVAGDAATGNGVVERIDRLQ